MVAPSRAAEVSKPAMPVRPVDVIIPFELHNFNRWVVISSSSSIEKKLRHRLFTQGHVAGKWQRYNQNAGLSDSATCALNQYTILFLASFH